MSTEAQATQDSTNLILNSSSSTSSDFQDLALTKSNWKKVVKEIRTEIRSPNPRIVFIPTRTIPKKPRIKKSEKVNMPDTKPSSSSTFKDVRLPDMVFKGTNFLSWRDRMRNILIREGHTKLLVETPEETAFIAEGSRC